MKRVIDERLSDFRKRMLAKKLVDESVDRSTDGGLNTFFLTCNAIYSRPNVLVQYAITFSDQPDTSAGDIHIRSKDEAMYECWEQLAGAILLKWAGKATDGGENWYSEVKPEQIVGNPPGMPMAEMEQTPGPMTGDGRGYIPLPKMNEADDHAYRFMLKYELLHSWISGGMKETEVAWMESPVILDDMTGKPVKFSTIVPAGPSRNECIERAIIENYEKVKSVIVLEWANQKLFPNMKTSGELPPQDYKSPQSGFMDHMTYSMMVEKINTLIVRLDGDHDATRHLVGLRELVDGMWSTATLEEKEEAAAYSYPKRDPNQDIWDAHYIRMKSIMEDEPGSYEPSVATEVNKIFDEGDLAMLRSGGPTMTVVHAGPDWVNVRMWTGSEMVEDTYQNAHIAKISK